jgi:hypothetical protein
MAAARVSKNMIGLAMNLAVFGFVGFEYLQTRETFYIVLAILIFFAPYLGKFLRASFGQSDKA